MFKNGEINRLLEMSKKMSRQLKVEMRIFDESINETIRNAPDEDKAKIEEIKKISQKAISLAQQGKINEANELIKDFRNGRKNN